MTEPMDDEWAPPGRAAQPREMEVRPLDGPVPGSPAALSDSPPGSPTALSGPPAPLSNAPAPPPGSSAGAVVPSGAVPTRITLPPGLRASWPPAAGPNWPLPAAEPNWASPDAPTAYPGHAAGTGRPATAPPPWAEPGASAPPGAPAGHPLANPDWSPGGPGPGWPNAGSPQRLPSGLFPSGPPRPTYREPLPVRPGAVAAGIGAGALWMLLFGLVASTVRQYSWWTISAAVAGWLAALVLARLGDRGVAVGVAMITGLGAAIAGSVVFAHFVGGHWVLW